ncbi:TadE/TadG family type IV pilus assembly protein [Sphingomonas sp.]|jgi:Flp pilus assembly protein TadG|uniref:TadE/TadG family type IV pilus assembly protein n=1 Tax=Sphingomonas sp. TaxID=28214 RepID=UPI002ED8CF3B
MIANLVTAMRRTLSKPGGRTRLRRDVRGVTAIEFGFVATPLMAIIIAILQVTLTFFAQQNLETASERAVRKLMTGVAQTSGMTREQFKSLVCAGLPAFMKCQNVMVDVRTATTFSSANTAAPTITYDSNGNPNNSWSFAPGGAGAITIVQIMYVWDVQKGPLGFDLATMSRGKRLLRATSVFKTESYS